MRYYIYVAPCAIVESFIQRHCNSLSQILRFFLSSLRRIMSRKGKILFKLRVTSTLYSCRETSQQVHFSLEESYPFVLSKGRLLSIFSHPPSLLIPEPGTTWHFSHPLLVPRPVTYPCAAREKYWIIFQVRKSAVARLNCIIKNSSSSARRGLSNTVQFLTTISSDIPTALGLKFKTFDARISLYVLLNRVSFLRCYQDMLLPRIGKYKLKIFCIANISINSVFKI